MKPEQLQNLLDAVKKGDLAVSDALDRLSPAIDAGPAIAEIDTDRLRRTGHPEVVFGQGKEPDDIVAILRRLAGANQPGLVTRLTDDKADRICAQLPDAKWHRRARVLHLPAPGHELTRKSEEASLSFVQGHQTYPSPKKPPSSLKRLAIQSNGSGMWALRAFIAS